MWGDQYINFPVPYESIQGVRVTLLGDGGDLALPLFDPSQGFPASSGRRQ